MPCFSKFWSVPFPPAREADDVESHQKLTFEGRPLDRPGEDIEDQGLAFDLGTLLNRRKALGLAGLGVSAFVLAACSSQKSATSGSATSTSSAPAPSGSTGVDDTYATEMPGETAGPYPGDGSNGQDVLEVTGVERSNITTSIGSSEKVAGVPLTLTLQVIDMANGNRPMANAAVYVWHCDAQGNYSMYSDGYTDQTWLRGVQVADAEGKVTFETIVPGCYAGRWPHIHFEVFASIDDIVDSTKAILTSQMAMPQEICDKVYALEAYSGSAANLAQITLETDNVFSDGWDMQLLPLTGSTDAGYTSDVLPVPIDTTTAPAAGSMPGGAGAPPAMPGA